MSTAIAGRPSPPAPVPSAAPWDVAPPDSRGPAGPTAGPQRRLPLGAEVRALPYHRLALADHRHRPWSPIVEGVLSGVLYLGASIVFVLFLMLGILAFDPEAADSFLVGDPNQMNMADPWLLVLLFGSVAIWLPIALFARWVMRPRPLALIWSVTGRIRWKYLLLTAGVAIAIYAVVQFGLGALLAVLAPAEETPPFEPQPWWWLSLILILLIVPIQCTAEEVVFRGYLAQMLGRWLRHPLFAILLPAPLFMLGHIYDIWGQLSVGMMAVVAGWVTWRTGGLEAAISLHVVNNLFATVIMLFVPYDPAAQSESVGWFGFTSSAVMQIAFALIAIRIAKRSGLAVTRRSPVWPSGARRDWERFTGLRASEVRELPAAAEIADMLAAWRSGAGRMPQGAGPRAGLPLGQQVGPPAAPPLGAQAGPAPRSGADDLVPPQGRGMSGPGARR
ncbi:CPBP family intramembrane glutamic endopeptidase [Kocuria palustris]|uniref:CPBP family intramembrane glutamic endopeptidase n=1 Tax=Kocuria palustris TaxID=71999 RepID=UPI0011A9B299|nr:type II CAAX endopeptidase family protein [Kocuria palustris]